LIAADDLTSATLVTSFFTALVADRWATDKNIR